MKIDELGSIERCPHDKENPYVMVSRDLIRDKNISFEVRGFIIYCLGFDKSWKISIPYFIKEQGICKDKMYRIVNEAIEAGYMKRITYKEGNLERTKYFVSEIPKFKKCFRHPEYQDGGNQDTGIQDATNKQVSSNDDTKNKQQTKKSEPAVGRVVVSFYEKLKGINPKVKKPDFDKWTMELELLIKDGNSIEDIERAIDFVIGTHSRPSSNGFCWANTILSPNSLRSNFAKIWASMNKAAPVSSAPKTESAFRNKKICETIERTFQQRFTSNVFFQAGPNSALLAHGAKDFRKEYIYDLFSTSQLKEILLRDLEVIFPGATDILLPPEPKVTHLIKGVAQQMRMAT